MRYLLIAVLLAITSACVAQVPSLNTGLICKGDGPTDPALGNYTQNNFDLPNQGAGGCCFSQVGIEPRGLEWRTANGAGRQGIHPNGTYAPLPRNINYIFGYDPRPRVHLAMENNRRMVECTKANFSTNVTDNTMAVFSTFSINDRPSAMLRNVQTGTFVYMKDLSAQALADIDNWDSLYVRVLNKELPPYIRDLAYRQWRTDINAIRRAYIPSDRVMDPRFLMAVEWLVSGDIFETKFQWVAPRCAATCKDEQSFGIAYSA